MHHDIEISDNAFSSIVSRTKRAHVIISENVVVGDCLKLHEVASDLDHRTGRIYKVKVTHIENLEHLVPGMRMVSFKNLGHFKCTG